MKTGSSASHNFELQIESGEILRSKPEGFDHDLKHFARVELRIEKHAVRHQVAAVGTFLEITMHPHANAGSAEIGDGGRETGEKFQIHRRIDAKPTHAQEHPDCSEKHRRDRRCRDGQHVASRNQIEDVDNEAIFLEGREVDVFASDHFDGSPNRIVGQHG